MREREHRTPEVNLLPRRERRLRLPVELGAQAGLVLVALGIWTIVGLAIAMLLGWHPHRLGGP
ncbi:MAG TPA: hypothetical protein VFD01_17795 [Candidatus Dormibacteraeota bacterium]|nr:hypothetical protein [Candidatus Dormibacteraeota bacterium]